MTVPLWFTHAKDLPVQDKSLSLQDLHTHPTSTSDIKINSAFHGIQKLWITKKLTYICEWQICVLQGDCDTLGTKPGELVGPLTDRLPTTRSELETTHSASPHNVPEPVIT